MVAMTRILERSSEAKDNLLATKHRISHAKTTSVEMSNIKQVIKMGAILEDMKEGKEQGGKVVENEVIAIGVAWNHHPSVHYQNVFL